MGEFERDRTIEIHEGSDLHEGIAEVLEDEKAEAAARKMVETCETWFTESKAWMEVRRERWRKNEALYNNDMEISGSSKSTKIKAPLVFAIIETQMPIVSDYSPTFDIKGEERNDKYFADMMQKRKQKVEAQSEFKDRVLDAVRDSLEYSNGLPCIEPIFEKIGAEAQRHTGTEGTTQEQDIDGQAGEELMTAEESGNENSGQPAGPAYRFTGKFRISVADPFTWFPSPGAVDIDIRHPLTRYQIFATPTHVAQIKKQYEKEVKGEGFLDEYMAFNVSKGGNAVESESGMNSNEGTKNNMALVKECYFMDDDLEKYPNGRLVVWANGTLLADQALLYPRINYFNLKNYGSAHSLFGMGEPELVRFLVKALNECISAIAENVKKTGNPIRKIVRRLWNQMKKKIEGTAGEDVVVDHPTDVSWEHPPSMSAQVFAFIDLLMKLIDIVSGIHDVTEGRKPAGITAAQAIRALQEAAQSRIRYKISKDISKLVREMGEFIVWVLQNFDQETREIRLRNEMGEDDYVLYDPVGTYDANGIPQGGENFDEKTAKTLGDSRLEIEVVGGSTIPAGRAESELRAMELYKIGAIGIEGLVMALAEPNKSDIVKDYYKRQGIEAIMKRMEATDKAYQELIGLTDTALSDPNWMGSLNEERMAKLLEQYPEFLNADEYQVLPDLYKERLVAVFLKKKDTGLAEQQEAATAPVVDGERL